VLVEAALAALRDIASPRIADVGTGTGALAIALARELPAARVVATDVSKAALAVALSNIREHGFAERVELRQGDLVEPLRSGPLFDAIVANLPYVTREEWDALEPEVRDHEPSSALIGGEDGLDLVRDLIAQAPVLANVPLVQDIRTMLRVLEHLGAEGWIEPGAGERGATRCRVRMLHEMSPDVPYDIVRTMRATAMVLGPLLARRGRARVS